MLEKMVGNFSSRSTIDKLWITMLYVFCLMLQFKYEDRGNTKIYQFININMNQRTINKINKLLDIMVSECGSYEREVASEIRAILKKNCIDTKK